MRGGLKVIEVEVHADHLERLTRTSPLRALAELIWNGLDAEATRVEVRLRRTPLDAIGAIEVSDDGHGMSEAEIEESFAGLGGSWKRLSEKTRSGLRVLHGKEGLGRFRAFTLGDRVEWASVAGTDSGPQRVTVTGTSAAPGTFRISDPETLDEDQLTGTLVVIRTDGEGLGQLLSDTVTDKLTYLLAPYLMRYPDVTVIYDGQELDPSVIIDRQSEYDLDLDPPARLTVVEWTQPMERALVLCDAEGFAVNEVAPGIHAPGYEFTAYVRSTALGELGSDAAVGELHPVVEPIVEVARDQLREHFRQRARDSSREIVERWVADGIYPYDGEASTPVEEAERTVFDVVAVEVERGLPGFSASGKQSRGLSLRLLREAIERSPTAVQSILAEVLGLSEEKQVELASLIGRTSLSAIITATKTVADRLDFLAGLEQLLFDREAKRQLLERRQLHRIVADQTWVFGEEFALTVDDRSLNEVLRRHLALAGRDESEIELASSDPVQTVDDGGTGIIDLMLSRLARRGNSAREHLVVELKRPLVKVGADELTQIEKYAFAVANDDRFGGTDTSWEFWVISNELDEHAKRKARQSDRAPGLVYRDDDARIRIWAKTWAEVIEEAGGRMRFYQEQMEYSPTVEQAREHLRTHFAEYLPPALASDEPGEEE